MKKTLVQCDLCSKAFRNDPSDKYCPGDADWERLEGIGGQFDVCPGCQNVIARAYHCGVLSQVVETVKK